MTISALPRLDRSPYVQTKMMWYEFAGLQLAIVYKEHWSNIHPLCSYLSCQFIVIGEVVDPLPVIEVHLVKLMMDPPAEQDQKT